MSLKEQQRANEKRLSRGTVIHTAMVLIPDPSMPKQWLKKAISGQYKCNGHLKLSKLERKAVKKAASRARFEDRYNELWISLSSKVEREAFETLVDMEGRRFLSANRESYIRDRVASLARLFKRLGICTEKEPTTCV